MTYRILVDENTSPRVAELLREKGHKAAHVSEALKVGATDQEIVTYWAFSRDPLDSRKITFIGRI